MSPAVLVANPMIKEALKAEGKQVSWFVPELNKLKGPPRRLLETYSGIDPEKVVPHILAVRDRAWEIWPYPCLGKMNFLDLSMSTSRLYPEILSRLIESKQTLLDIGCCFAQDIRKLVSDGAPSENLYGVELRQPFVDLGYELFGDKTSLKSTFIVGDFLSESILPAFSSLEGKIDMIYAASIFHLFNWDDQVRLAILTVNLLKPEPGSLLWGRQRGNVVAGEYEHRTDAQTTMYKHDESSFKRMWDEISKKTGTLWHVTVWLQVEDDFGLGLHVDDRRLYFEVRRD